MYMGDVSDGPGAEVTAPDRSTVQQTSWIAQLVPTLAAAYREKQIIKVQTQRMRQGLQPLPVENLSPPIRLQTTIDPGRSANTSLMLIGVGVVGLAAFFLLSKRTKR